MRWGFAVQPSRLSPALALAMLLLPVSVQGAAPAWQRAETAHFTLYSTADSTELLHTARELERMAEVIRLWGLGSPTALRSRVVLIGLPDKKSFEPHQLVVDGKHQDNPGYVTSQPSGYWIGYQEDDPRGRVVAHHEYAHTLIDERYQSVPLCLHEGLAEYLSTFATKETACQLGGDIPGHRYTLKRNTPYSLDELFAVGADSPIYRESGDRTLLFYGESWALVHYLMQKSVGGAVKLQRLLETMADGAAPRSAFASVYPQEDWSGLPARLQTYTDRGELKGPEISFTQAFEELQVDLQAAAPGEVAVHLGLWRAMNPAVAPSATAALLRQGQEQPALAPLAAAGLGLTAWEAGDLDEALLRFRDAVAAKPADALALSIAGLGVLQLAALRQEAAQDSLVLEAYRILSRSVILDATDAKAQRGHEECAAFLRARAESVQAGHQQQDSAALRKATAKYNTGIVALNGRDYARALEVFTLLSESAPDSALRAKAKGRIADIADFEDFDRGVAAANAQDLLGALRVFERLAAETANPDLRSQAAANARELQAALRESSGGR